jgi:hypothetical protein
MIHVTKATAWNPKDWETPASLVCFGAIIFPRERIDFYKIIVQLSRKHSYIAQEICQNTRVLRVSGLVIRLQRLVGGDSKKYEMNKAKGYLEKHQWDYYTPKKGYVILID